MRWEKKHARKGPKAKQTDGNPGENKVREHQINKKVRDQRNSKLKRSSRNKGKQEGRKRHAVRVNQNRHSTYGGDQG